VKKLFIFVLLMACPGFYAQSVDDFIELLRSDVQKDKVAIITQVMAFTDQQAEAFWLIYNDFSYELTKLSDQRIANIKDFAANYDSLKEEKANQLMENAFSFQSDRLDLNEKYYNKFADALGAIVAAKYMQLEYEIQLIIDLSVNSSLPLAKKPGE